MSTGGLLMSRRIRRTPYTDRVEASGVSGFTVVNHMLLPKAYRHTVEQDYWHLRKYVQLWDVSCQRQVRIRGRDAARLVQWMTPRDISRAKVGQCLYAPLVDDDGGLINDPVMLMLAPDHYWLSIADSDVLLWAKGLATGAGMDVRIDEPDVFPLAIQGPKAEDLLADLFGEHIRRIGFFRFDWIEFEDTRQLIARSGYSRQGGFEIYLEHGVLGGHLWDTLIQAGKNYNIRPGCPNLIERIEGGLLSYGNEMTRQNNPLECDLAAFCQLDADNEFLGKSALREIAEHGIRKQIRGISFDGEKCPVCSVPWPVYVEQSGKTLQIGQITSAIYSPRLKKNVGQSMIPREYWDEGQAVLVECPDGHLRQGQVVVMPFSTDVQ